MRNPLILCANTHTAPRFFLSKTWDWLLCSAWNPGALVLIIELEGPFHNMLGMEKALFVMVPHVTSSLKVWVLIPTGNPFILGTVYQLQGTGKQKLQVLSSCLHALDAGPCCLLWEPCSLSCGR